LADLSGTNPDRLSGISDGIFSVGMTLLVLGLVVPTVNGVATTEGQLWDTIRSLTSSERRPPTTSLAVLMRGRILIAQSLYAGAALLCVIFPTWVSIALITLIQVNYVLAPRIPILGRF
jgi:uncharacterized membrane protein